jgi:CubicO group peptidase (beta-lactamase class C family)
MNPAVDGMRTDTFPGRLLADRYDAVFDLLELRRGATERYTSYQPTDAEIEWPIDGEAIFWLGCLAKTVTATAIALLAERGALSMSDPVRRYLGASSLSDAITVRHLLTHSGGFPRNLPDWRSFFDADWLAEPLSAVADRIVTSGSGIADQRAYSSVGFALLGRIAEIVSGVELGALIAHEIFEPLGMRDSFCVNAIPAAKHPRILPVFAQTGGDRSLLFAPGSRTPVVNSMPFAGIFSTARDVGRFVQMLVDGGCHDGSRLLRESTIELMCREHTSGQGMHQGLGWFVCFRADGGPRHGGADGFWHTSSSGSMVVVDRSRGAATIILGQSLLDRGLVPVRMAEWEYIERTLRLLPVVEVSQSPEGAQPWLRELSASLAMRSQV